MAISIDGTSHTPSTVAFVGFSGVENNGIVTLSGSNFTYYAGTNISIDGSNTISCDLSPPDPYVAGDGIQVSGQTISNTKPMCDVAFFTGSTETVIPGDQITALKFPIQMTYDCFPSSGYYRCTCPAFW